MKLKRILVGLLAASMTLGNIYVPAMAEELPDGSVETEITEVAPEDAAPIETPDDVLDDSSEPNATEIPDEIIPEVKDPEESDPLAEEPKAEEPKAEEPSLEDPDAEDPDAEKPEEEPEVKEEVITLDSYNMTLYFGDGSLTVTIDEAFPADSDSAIAKAEEAAMKDEVKDAFAIEGEYEVTDVTITNDGITTSASEFDYSQELKEASIDAYLEAIEAEEEELTIEQVKTKFGLTIKVFDPTLYEDAESYVDVYDELPSADFECEEDEFFKDYSEVKAYVNKFIKSEEAKAALTLDAKAYTIDEIKLVCGDNEAMADDFNFESEIPEGTSIVAVVEPRVMMLLGAKPPTFKPEYISNVTYVPVTFYNYSEDRVTSSNFTFVQNGSGDANAYTGGHYPKFGLAAADITGGNFKLANGLTLTSNNGGGQPFQGGSGYNFPFLVDGNGYYTFDSNSNFVTTKDADGSNLKLYAKPGYLKDGDNLIKGFMPFNKVSKDYNDGYQITESNDYFFGMSLETGFVMPYNGQVNGQDMIFDFSGDDDVWVYVDDKLVLDIGGIHQSVSGSINFATGVVEVNGSQTGTIELSGNTKHTMRFFYLERGAGETNCRIRFNLQDLFVPPTYVYNEVHHYLNKRTQESFQDTKSETYENDTFTAVPIPERDGKTYTLVDVKVNGNSDVRDSYTFTNENVNIDFYYELVDYTHQEIHEYTNVEDSSKNATITGDVIVYGDNDTFVSNAQPNKDGLTYKLVAVYKNGEPIETKNSYTFVGKEDQDVVIKYCYKYELPSYTFEEDHYYTNLDDNSKGQIDGKPESYKGYKPSDSKCEFEGKTYTLVKVTKNGNKLVTANHYSFEAQTDKDVHIEYYYEYESPKYQFREIHTYNHIDDKSLSGSTDTGFIDYKFDKESNAKYNYNGLSFTLKSVKINGEFEEPMKALHTFNGQVDKNVTIEYYYEYELPKYQFEEDHFYLNKDSNSEGKIDKAAVEYKGDKHSEAKCDFAGKTYTLVEVKINGVSKTDFKSSYDFNAQKDHNIHIEYFYEFESPKYQFEEDHFYTNHDDPSLSGAKCGDAIDYKFDKHSEAIPEYNGTTYVLTRVKINGNEVDPLASSFDFYGQTDKNIHIKYFYEFESPKYKFEEDHYYTNYDDSALSGSRDGDAIDYKFEKHSEAIPEYNGTTYVLTMVKINGKEVDPLTSSFDFYGQTDKNIHIEYFYEFESPKYKFHEIHYYDHLDNNDLDGTLDKGEVDYKFTMDSTAIYEYKGVTFELVGIKVNDKPYDISIPNFRFIAAFSKDVKIEYFYKASYPRYNFEEDHYYVDLDDGAKHEINNDPVEYYSAKTSKAITLCEDGQVYKLVKVLVNEKEVEILDEYTFDPINKGDKDVHIEYFYEFESDDLNVKSFHHYELNKGELGTDKATVSGIDKTFRKSYNYSEEVKPEYDGRTYKLSYVTVNNEKITEDFDSLTEYKATFKENAVIDYYYTLSLPVYHGTVKHIYINDVKGTKTEISEDPSVFVEKTSRVIESKPEYDSVIYELTGMTIDDEAYTYAGKEEKNFTKDFEIVYTYHYYGPDLNGIVKHEYKDLSSGDEGFIVTRIKTFKIADKFAEKQLTSYGGKDDYVLVSVTVNGTKVELKESYEFEMRENYTIIFTYERKDKDVPPPEVPDPKPEPEPEPQPEPQAPLPQPQPQPEAPKLPQTGGLSESVALPIGVGAILLVLGGLAIANVILKKKDEDK